MLGFDFGNKSQNVNVQVVQFVLVDLNLADSDYFYCCLSSSGRDDKQSARKYYYNYFSDSALADCDMEQILMKHY